MPAFKAAPAGKGGPMNVGRLDDPDVAEAKSPSTEEGSLKSGQAQAKRHPVNIAQGYGRYKSYSSHTRIHCKYGGITLLIEWAPAGH